MQFVFGQARHLSLNVDEGLIMTKLSQLVILKTKSARKELTFMNEFTITRAHQLNNIISIIIYIYIVSGHQIS